MAFRDVNKFTIRIDNEAAWHNIMEISNDKLVIVDIHQDW